MTKYCPKCMAETERCKDGSCKPCKKAYQCEYYTTNREHICAKVFAYRKANREKINVKKSAYQKANRDKQNARNKAWRKANPEKSRARNSAYYSTNYEKKREFAAKWYRLNIYKAKQYIRSYVLKMPDAYIAITIRKSNNQLKQAKISSEMIEAKRAELKLKRLIKELKK